MIAQNPFGFITLQDILDDKVAEDDTSNPHDFTLELKSINSLKNLRFYKTAASAVSKKQK